MPVSPTFDLSDPARVSARMSAVMNAATHLRRRLDRIIHDLRSHRISGEATEDGWRPWRGAR